MRPILNVVGKTSYSHIQHQGITFGIARGGRLPNGTYDAVIIDSAIPATVEETITSVRTQSGIQALVPLFISRNAGIKTESLIHTDGFADYDALDSSSEIAQKINARLERISEPQQKNISVQNEFKFLAFLYSRNTIYSPVASRSSLFGYVFPLLGLIYKNEAQPIFKLIDRCVADGKIATTFKDQIHLCRSCDSNYLNFRESCPSCKSGDITARDMIHHFVCAHVAPQDDFDKGDHLACPKCDKHLRHIGIDYDKPSSIFSCNSCSHEFQNPDMQAQCTDCCTSNNLDELRPQKIGNYSLTSTGEQALINTGNTVVMNHMSTTVNLEKSLPVPIFKLLVNQEIKRISNLQTSSIFVDIQIESEILEQLNDSSKEGLKQELTDIISSYLSPADLICSNNFKHYQLLLPDTKSSPDRLSQIDYNLKKLLGDNLSDEMLKVRLNTTTLLQDTNVESLF